MRPSKPPMFIQQKTSAGTIQYCPTPPLPPWVTEKPWWERLRDRQRNAQINSAGGESTPATVGSPPSPASESPNNYGNSGDHGNPKHSGNPRKWTWTLIDIDKEGISRRQTLRRSPEGRLILKEELVGAPFTIVAENYNSSVSADPRDRLHETTPSRPIINVQIGAHDYVGVYALPDGRPELPATHAAEYHAVPKRNGSWCFLPNGFSSVPPSWEMFSIEPPEPIASKSASDSESQKVTPQLSKTPAGSSPATQVIESVPTTNLPQAAEKTTEAKEMLETKDTNSSDHPIPRSPDHPIPAPDHPISSESPEDIMDQLEQDIARYLVCSPHQRVVLALWILHTYCYAALLPLPPTSTSIPHRTIRKIRLSGSAPRLLCSTLVCLRRPRLHSHPQDHRRPPYRPLR